jgi:hypothetical protein
MPSILKTKARRVLRYFNKYGFDNVNLTVYIMRQDSSLDDIIKFEQYFIDTLKPSLNVDLVASGTGYHGYINIEAINKLHKQRGTPIYVYDITGFTLLYMFESKQHMFNSIKIHHNTLSNCLDTGTVYLDSFFLSIDVIEESETNNILNLEEIKQLINNKRKIYDVKHPAYKKVLAEFKGDSSKNLEFPSLTSLANNLKGDRQTIRQYLNKKKTGYYRGK